MDPVSFKHYWLHCEMQGEIIGDNDRSATNWGQEKEYQRLDPREVEGARVRQQQPSEYEGLQ